MEPFAIGLGGAGVATPYLLKFFDWFKENRDQKTQKTQEAVKAVSEALYETVTYIHQRQENGANSDTERKLYKYWNTASDALRGVNEELSELCSMKGRWWLDKESLSSEEFDKIEINKITEDIRQFKKIH